MNESKAIHADYEDLVVVMPDDYKVKHIWAVEIWKTEDGRLSARADYVLTNSDNVRDICRCAGGELIKMMICNNKKEATEIACAYNLVHSSGWSWEEAYKTVRN